MRELAQKAGMERTAKMVASSASIGPTDRMYLPPARGSDARLSISLSISLSLSLMCGGYTAGEELNTSASSVVVL